jgi:hypothetical protein
MTTSITVSVSEPACAVPAREHARLAGARESRILLLSSSLLTDRMLLHTAWLRALGDRATVWATSYAEARYRDEWSTHSSTVEQFPEVLPFRDFPFNHLRRLNEFAWDLRTREPSRLSILRLIREKNMRPDVRAMKLPARLVSLARCEALLENGVERAMLKINRSPEAFARLAALRPDVVVTTGPFQFEQPAVVAAAKALGIPTVALIPSWDNITTKGRLVFKYDGYLVWSERTRAELLAAYPAARSVPIFTTGAPQFDAFFDDRFALSREVFCRKSGLSPDLPIVVYALGTPNMIKEHHGALFLAERIARGDLGDVQMLVRPHPIHDDGSLEDAFSGFGPRVRLQHTADGSAPLTARSQNTERVLEWVNTFRHAAVVVNLSSTVTVDAAVFDVPVANLDYDPEPGEPNRALVREINHVWSHFKPIAESGGVWLVTTPRELVEAVRTYLARPDLHRRGRRWIAEHVCGRLDGRCGARAAEALLEFADRVVAGRAQL